MQRRPRPAEPDWLDPGGVAPVLWHRRTNGLIFFLNIHSFTPQLQDWDKNIYFNCSSEAVGSREACGVPFRFLSLLALHTFAFTFAFIYLLSHICLRPSWIHIFAQLLQAKRQWADQEQAMWLWCPETGLCKYSPLLYALLSKHQIKDYNLDYTGKKLYYKSVAGELICTKRKLAIFHYLPRRKIWNTRKKFWNGNSEGGLHARDIRQGLPPRGRGVGREKPRSRRRRRRRHKCSPGRTCALTPPCPSVVLQLKALLDMCVFV